jgi:ankyrin repeat protein
MLHEGTNRANISLRFLLAQLHQDSLIGKRSPKAIRSALETLPKGSEALDNAYKEAMERIEGQIIDSQELAKQVLSWIVCSKRPLTTLELQHALGVEVGESELDEENLPELKNMVSVYAGLATVDELESKDSRYGQTPLVLAAKNGHEAVVKLLVEKGAELESKDDEFGRRRCRGLQRTGTGQWCGC